MFRIDILLDQWELLKSYHQLIYDKGDGNDLKKNNINPKMVFVTSNGSKIEWLTLGLRPLDRYILTALRGS